jgi:glutamine synthetase
MSASASFCEVTLENIGEILKNDTKVKLAGVDVDGQLRGKLISKKKFLSIAADGFGFCSVIFGWDMHDRTYFKELAISNKENGYQDLVAVPDLSSFRRIPWENDVPFFLVSFFDPETREPVCACPRGLLKTALSKVEAAGYHAMAGAEYEFYQFRAPGDYPTPERNASATAAFLQKNPVEALPALTEGMFGYSLTRPIHNQDYYYGIFDACERFNCEIEGWHTESGPGVFEAVSVSLADGQCMADAFRHYNSGKPRRWQTRLSDTWSSPSARNMASRRRSWQNLAKVCPATADTCISHWLRKMERMRSSARRLTHPRPIQT